MAISHSPRFPTGAVSRIRLAAGFALAGAFLIVGACGDSDPTDPGTDIQVQAVIEGASAEGASVSARAGAPAQDASAPPAILLSGTTAMIEGGGATFTIGTNSTFSEIFIFIEGRDGYYHLTFNSPRETVNVTLTYGEDLGESGYTLHFAVGTGSGAGAVASQTAEVVEVGTGDVQVSVAWDVPSDVDLHVVEPSGEEIYYGNRTSATGGQLDLDSNAGCGGQDVRNEHITWPDGPAPSGEYVVRVNYWSACGQPETNWVVTVRVTGQATRTFQGTFTGSGNGGGLGAGEVITTFTH